MNQDLFIMLYGDNEMETFKTQRAARSRFEESYEQGIHTVSVNYRGQEVMVRKLAHHPGLPAHCVYESIIEIADID